MLRLGITGGIGSGKSTVCKIFELLGVPVYYADQRSKFLVSNNQQIREKIIRNFGSESFVNGEYNRTYISQIVFANKEKLELLNSIIHPYVLADWDDFCSRHKDSPYLVKEAAIMLETESRNSVDKIALVYAPKQLRIERIQSRDGLDKQAIESRMDKQMPEEDKLKLADYIIYNDGSQSLIDQVLKLHRSLVG